MASIARTEVAAVFKKTMDTKKLVFSDSVNFFLKKSVEIHLIENMYSEFPNR